MPTGPVLDSHVHVWDPAILDYAWLSGDLDRRDGPAEFAADDGGESVDRVFVQADCAPEQSLAEADWVTTLAEEARIVGIVAAAPLEAGASVVSDVRALAERGLVIGVRRLLQGESRASR
ncbi:hypothetical protein GCM10010910_28310 [Microbacterium nanhaiense]|uniref:Amidohydrolase n=2 Tax=Microbacterium nanhaiense TaxID=1301026 RepID=A0ABQ2N3I7_9MICO|nr:hypothetical protein GCM10010910_28310 [Microbacterium nanhaiense]